MAFTTVCLSVWPELEVHGPTLKSYKTSLFTCKKEEIIKTIAKKNQFNTMSQLEILIFHQCIIIYNPKSTVRIIC